MRSVRQNFIMDMSYQFTNKEVTPWGGMVFLKQFLTKMRFSDQVSTCSHLLHPGSNRGYSPVIILESFICSVWWGFFIPNWHVATKIFNWKIVPGQDTYKRFFSKFTQTDNLRVADYFFRWIFENYHYDNFTVDFDSSVLTRYGVQEGAKRGYNPQKKGRASHHLLQFWFFVLFTSIL